MATLKIRSKKGSLPKVPLFGNTGALVILLGILFLMIYYIASVSPSERAKLIGDDVIGNRILLSASPGLIEGTTVEIEAHKITDFVVDFSSTTNSRLLRSQIIISRALFKDTASNFDFELEKGKVSGAQLVFIVEDVAGESDLSVFLNGNLLYQNSPETTEQVFIPLPNDVLLDGKNSVSISVAPPGLRFWRKTDYTLADLQLVTEDIIQGKRESEQIIVLSTDEVSGARTVSLSALVSQLAEPSRLEIYFNGEVYYNSTPKKLQDININIPKDKIRIGRNAIKWAVEQGGKYKITFAALTTRSRLISNNVYRFKAFIGDTSRIYSGTYGCELTISRSSGAENIAVDFNEYVLDYSFRQKDEITDATVCPYIREGLNTIMIAASRDITIDRLRLELKTE